MINDSDSEKAFCFLTIFIDNTSDKFFLDLYYLPENTFWEVTNHVFITVDIHNKQL